MPSQVGLQGQHRPPLVKYTACFQSKIRVFLPERRRGESHRSWLSFPPAAKAFPPLPSHFHSWS